MIPLSRACRAFDEALRALRPDTSTSTQARDALPERTPRPEDGALRDALRSGLRVPKTGLCVMAGA